MKKMKSTGASDARREEAFMTLYAALENRVSGALEDVRGCVREMAETAGYRSFEWLHLGQARAQIDGHWTLFTIRSAEGEYFFSKFALCPTKPDRSDCTELLVVYSSTAQHGCLYSSDDSSGSAAVSEQ